MLCSLSPEKRREEKAEYTPLTLLNCTAFKVYRKCEHWSGRDYLFVTRPATKVLPFYYKKMNMSVECNNDLSLFLIPFLIVDL